MQLKIIQQLFDELIQQEQYLTSLEKTDSVDGQLKMLYRIVGMIEQISQECEIELSGNNIKLH